MVPTLRRVFRRITNSPETLVTFGFAVWWFVCLRGVADYPSFDGDDSGHFAYASVVPVRKMLLGEWFLGHPPLYFIILKVWMYFGISEAHIRALNHCAAWALVLTWFAAMRRWLRPGAAVLSMAALASAPMLFYLTYQLRDYTIALFFCAVAWLSFDCWRKDRKTIALLVFIAAILLAFFSAYGAILILGPLLAVHYWVLFTQPHPKKRSHTLLSLVPAVVIALVYVLVVQPSLRMYDDGYYRETRYHSGMQTNRWEFAWDALVRNVVGLLTDRVEATGWFALVAVGVVILSVIAFVWDRSGGRDAFVKAVLVSAPLFLAMLLCALGMYPGGYHRHTVFLILPLSAILGFAAHTLIEVGDRVSRAKLPTGFVSGVIVVGAVAIGVHKSRLNREAVLREFISAESTLSGLRRAIVSAELGALVLLDRASWDLARYYRAKGVPTPQMGERLASLQNEFLYEDYSYCHQLPDAWTRAAKTGANQIMLWSFLTPFIDSQQEWRSSSQGWTLSISMDSETRSRFEQRCKFITNKRG